MPMASEAFDRDLAAGHAVIFVGYSFNAMHGSNLLNGIESLPYCQEVGARAATFAALSRFRHAQLP